MDSLEEVEEAIRSCRACPLHSSRRNPVPGEGSGRSGIMFVGEAPGRNEDAQGRPFVGAAGQLLDGLIEGKLRLRRNDVYITNIVKCRPPGNRDPEPDEARACWRFLEAQIRIIKPRIIVALGRHAATTLLFGPGSRTRSIMALRGRPRAVRIADVDVTIFPALHPAAALYNKQQLSMLEEDFEGVAMLAMGGRKKGTLDEFL